MIHIQQYVYWVLARLGLIRAGVAAWYSPDHPKYYIQRLGPGGRLLNLRELLNHRPPEMEDIIPPQILLDITSHELRR